jgi:hypothetical protein
MSGEGVGGNTQMQLPWFNFRACWDVRVSSSWQELQVVFYVRHREIMDETPITVCLNENVEPYPYPVWEVFPVNGDIVRYPGVQHERVLVCVDREFKRLLKARGKDFRSMGPKW